MHTAGLLISCLILSLRVRSSLCQTKCPVDSSTQEGFNYVAFSNGSGALGLIGDVNDVLVGAVTPETNSNIWTHINTGPFGFGAAAIGPLAGLGEAIFVNGEAIVRSTDNGTKEYFQTIRSKEFRTPFSLFVINGTTPNGNAVFHTQMNSRNISIFNFYERVHLAVGRQPFCFFGLTEFVQLEAIAVSKAPIYGEPLFGDSPTAAGYYTQPNFQLPNVYGFTFGCAANFSTIQDQALNASLLKLLYLNPRDSGSRGQLQVHSHVLSLRNCLKSPAEINASSAQDVYHLLSNATISFISANVYTLSRGDQLVELTQINNAPNSITVNVGISLCSFLVFISVVYSYSSKFLQPS